MRRAGGISLWGVVIGSLLVAVLGWPALATALAATRGGIDSGGGLLSPIDPATGGLQRPLQLAGETLRLVLATEAMALPIGIILAFGLFRTDLPGRRVGMALLALGAFVPLPLHATAWLGAFGNAGRSQVLGLGTLPVLRGWAGSAFVHAMAALPWVVLVVGVGLRAVEPELEDAGRLDLPGPLVVWRVTLRRSLGAILGASLAVAVLTAGDMTVTDLLRVRTYAEEAYLQYNLGNGPASAAAVTLPPLLLLGALVTLAARGLLTAEPARLPSLAPRARPWSPGRWRVPLSILTLGFIGTFVGLPLFSLVWRAGRVGGNAAAGLAPFWSLDGLLGTLRFAWDEAREPLGSSLAWASLSASAGVVLAWSLAWFSRTPGPWRGITAVSLAVALATPGPVAGFALVYGYRGFPRVYDSAAMVVLAGVLRTFPYALLVLWPAIRTIPREYLDAAAVDGLGTRGVVGRVAIPLTRGATFAAWGVAFTLSLGELPATNLVAPPGITPLSVVIWGLLHTGVESHLAGVVLIMIGAVGAAGLITLAALARSR